MSQTTGDTIVGQLLRWGVDTPFGLPGDGINGIFEALRKNQKKIRLIQCRHEEAAAFAACGYAKFTGRLGVCFATSGPGAIHLLNGLYDAKLDHAPVLFVVAPTRRGPAQGYARICRRAVERRDARSRSVIAMAFLAVVCSGYVHRQCRPPSPRNHRAIAHFCRSFSCASST